MSSLLQDKDMAEIEHLVHRLREFVTTVPEWDYLLPIILSPFILDLGCPLPLVYYPLYVTSVEQPSRILE